MKLLKGLESLVNAGKNIGRLIEKNAKLGLLSGALVLGSAGNIFASRGTIEVANRIDIPYTSSICRIVHSTTADALEGKDSHDNIYGPSYNPSGVASFITSSVGGYKLDNDVRPENSTSSISLSLGLVFESGSGQITSSNYLSISCEGFDGEDVYVNGQDAKKTSTIQLPNLVNQGSGTYGSVEVSFSPHTPPEPNEPNNPPIEPNEPGIPGNGTSLKKAGIIIENHVPAFLESQHGRFKFVQMNTALNGVDPNDVLYVPTNSGSKIVSITKGNSRRVSEYSTQAVPLEGFYDVILQLSTNGNRNVTSDNEFVISSLEKGPINQKISLQQFNPLYSNEQHVVYGLADAARTNQGRIRISRLENQRPGVPYSFWRISENTLRADVNGDGKMTLEDVALEEASIGLQGDDLRGDIASSNGWSPDGLIDAKDVAVAITEYNLANPKTQIPNHYKTVEESFESEIPFETRNTGDPYRGWRRTPDESHTGDFSLASGTLQSYQISGLEISIPCNKGNATYWEMGIVGPLGKFTSKINGEVIEEKERGDYSEWSQTSFDVESGTNTLEFKTQEGSYAGVTKMYIDDIELP